MESILRYSAAGFRQDMEELFNRFLSTDKESDSTTSHEISLRFSRFAEVWRQMKFSHVFRLRYNENDLKDFVEQIFLEVLPHLCENYPLERRVCALYLLYCLYVKQPKSRQAIRMNFAHLEQIRALIQKCKQLSQLDVCYVWFKLLSMGAIDMVYVSRLMGPQYMHKCRNIYETQTETDLIIDQFKTSMFSPLMELSHIHERYRTLKDSLADTCPKIDEQCSHVKDNIFDLTKAKVDNLHKQYFNSIIPTVDSEDDGIDYRTDSEDSQQSDIRSKKRRLNEMASGFGQNLTSEVVENQSVNEDEATKEVAIKKP